MRIATGIASFAAALAVAAPALAARGDAGPAKAASSISLASPGQPSYGDTVEFTVATTATEQPYVNLKCQQGSELVNDSWRSYFGAGLADLRFALSTPTWTGGAADCTASLTMWFNGRNRVLATTSFHVSA